MSATATQSPPTRRCPQCRAPMAPEQDWCLECGTAVTTRVARAPVWGLPVAIVLGALAIVAAATLITINALQDDADKAAGPAARARTTAATRTTGATGGASASRQAAADVPLWPTGRQGYTIIVAAPTSRAIAVGKARALRRLGRDAGILHSDDYDFLSAGLWVVWRGKYPTRAAAERSELKVKRVVPSAYATLVRPRTS